MAASVKAITSRDNPLLQRLRRLGSDPAGYRRLGEIWIEGEHLCAALVARGGCPTHAVITEPAWHEPSLRDLAERASEVTVVSKALMASVSTLESPAALGFVVPWSGTGRLDPHASSVVLDRLQDAGNVGNVLRSAAAFGFRQVIALKGTAALWSPKVLRAGMGAHFGLVLVETVESLTTLAVPLYATSSHAATAVHEADLAWPCAWLFGHEGQGVAPPLLGQCAATLRIWQPGGEESLNVAAAAAVCLHESVRRGLLSLS